MDLETTGLNPRADTIVCIGVAWSAGSIAIDTRDRSILDIVVSWLEDRRHAGWFAFNSQFDGGFVRKHTGKAPHLSGCALLMFKLMATEGWLGQRHNLSTAIETILNWPENTKDIIPELLEERGLSKGQMCLLMDSHPTQFLKYCAQDADAAYQIMHTLRRQANDQGFTDLIEQHDMLWTNMIQLHIEQQLRGMDINVHRLEQYNEKLSAELAELEHEFRSHKDVAQLIIDRDKGTNDEWYKPIKGTKKIWAKKSDSPSALSGWTKGQKKNPAIWEKACGGPWYKEAVTFRPRKRKATPKLFNLGSDKDLRWLYYETHGDSNLIIYRTVRDSDPDNEKPWLRLGQIEIKVGDNIACLDMTKGGAFPVDKKAMTFFGETGAILKKISSKRTQIQYNTSLITATEDNNLYPQVRVFGAVTGRGTGGGGGVSIQILPKDIEYLSCLRARDGHKLVHLDFSSAEPTVMTELSGDPLYREIYASGKPHDIYLFMAIHNDRRGKEIDAVYNMTNPTAESVAAAKKKFPIIRAKWKLQVLMSSYLAGAEKKRRGAQQEGIWMTPNEGKEAHKSYNDSLAGLDRWRNSLKESWNTNGGWVMNALGRPVSCGYNQTKDLGSRVVQSGAHDILGVYLHFITKLRRDRAVVMFPWDVDVHDATVWEAPNHHVEGATNVLRDALTLTNKFINGDIPFKGDVDVGDTFADFKD